ncbi:putative disease resistance RPP13-like protein 1 [Arachis hypogaea]|uniref:putative disease resistance RPP13-like protein 1 n=1 Tax=Arachis hypogaea TaxID=3818 RepID=UPI000DECC1A2|nr:putative disease resistance protein At3g14460 [Arachis hypogaea]XP_025631466.1 putative disease resistance protein At3g14460 [Arachis hypogaea]XP_025631467.1 putative disease resistance protein At3g14460 [Arachis hypogaea]XP_025631468.1 putative disease resistance protein At3g14460 [Arachis hypogaea]
MAGALVGGALLSGFINVVFDRFITTDAVNLILGKKLGPELVERLKISLLAAEALVGDAEFKQLDNPSVREWLNSLRDAVYVADDLLDAVLTKAATRKEVRSFWPISFLDRDRKIVDKMEGVVRRIEFLVKQKDLLGLEKSSYRDFLSWRIPSTSLVEGNILGREKDQQEIIKILNDNREHQLSVIPIVGIGGVGKTTLAQWLYNNEKLMEGFQVKKWVCVSEDFNVIQVTKNIIGQTAGNTEDFNSLQLELKEKLFEKKFFIVLDDVWSDDGDVWKKFRTPFQYGIKGSTILVTTRVKEVASVVQTCPPYILSELSEDCCWSVFANNVCFPESNGHPKLEEIGRKIVKKCKGLPLAAETLGSLLRTKHDVKEWEAVLVSDIWEFSVKNSKIIPALLISYFHLPAHLKRCFVYCSLYPKDHCFHKTELILLWMAEDLLRPPNRGEILLEVGRKCFDELASRLFFKRHDRYASEWFVMHDLLHDLALFLAGDFYGRFEELGDAVNVYTRTRHLSCKSPNHLVSKNFSSISKVESLRTFLSTNVVSKSDNIDDVTCTPILKLKYLRVLSLLSFKALDVLPRQIGKLTYLRYLDLSRTCIRTLPESLCDLYNLQTLKLVGCSSLTMLPNGMHKLVNLQHLNILGTPLKEMPRGMSKLQHLHTLSYFIVGKHKDNGIQELELLNLYEFCHIKKLENVVDVKEARSARIIDKKHIDNLRLEWSSGDYMVSSTQTERDILDSLQPHHGLEVLQIKGYKGTIFPNWMGHCSYQNMAHVSLESCKNCCMLPSLGQLPSLKSLRIQGFHQLRSIGMEFYKNEGDHRSSLLAPFPSLEILEFNNMPCWEAWHLPDSETFPQLRKLQIRDCPVLTVDILDRVFLRIISSLWDVSKVRRLNIHTDYEGESEMSLREAMVSIKGCESMLKFVLQAMSVNHLSCLKDIYISGWSLDVLFRDSCVLKSLQTLKIWGCSKLEFPQQQQKYSLVELYIDGSCDSLTSLSLDDFPNLKTLTMIECKNLKSVSLSEPSHAALQRLTIFKCRKFVSFTGKGLAAPNLTRLEVSFCTKLEALPLDMNTLLPSLQSLEIEGCREICRLPEVGLPPNLKQLVIEKQWRSLSSMGNLDTLTHLIIDGFGSENVKSFPEAGSLPHLPSLTTLKISRFGDLETLECNQLLSLTSLQQLHIEGCNKLKNMAGEKLPSSLLLLQIDYCHLLGEHCKNKHQQIWPKISHIPSIQVGTREVFLERTDPLSLRGKRMQMAGISPYV